MIGCHIVEIDTREELDRALEEPVAMVVLLGKQEHLSSVRLEEIASVCKPRGIPIMVDAASEHIERPSPWLERGADLVVYSGGKFLRGPQTSGLLLGNKRLCQAAWRNGSPHQALGRPMKVRRRTSSASSRRSNTGSASATKLPSGANGTPTSRRSPSGSERSTASRGEILEPSGVDKVPRLKIVWDRARFPLDGLGLRHAVLDGEPRVMLDDNSATDDSIAIDPFQLQPGEAAQVGDAIVAALRASLTNRPPATRAPGPDVAGDWELRVDFMHGARTHRLALEQSGGDIAGTSARRSSRGRSAAKSTATASVSPSPAATRRRRFPTASRAASRTARWKARCCSAPPATRTRASSTAPSSAPGRGRRGG